MYAWASATFWGLLDPSLVIPAVLLAGVPLLWTRWARSGRWITTAGALAMLAVASSPLAGFLTVTLEERFPAPAALPEQVTGIILLGGSIDLSLSDARGIPVANHSANRFVRFADLAQRYPTARLVFTGAGNAGGAPGARSEAEHSLELLRIIGVDLSRVEVESRATNTWDNAVLARQLVDPGPDEVWLLVTSAWHMPRAMGCFQKVGWDVVPMPSWFTSSGPGGWSLGFAP
ncbi:MAG: YdcF family protein, partial [Proteobacteria bacterium]|nr:YdcF family protein [Pseudomonadota bacterium]